MAEDGSPIGVWSYAARVHRYAWRWAWRHWKTMLLTAGVLGLATALSLVPYAMALGPGASLNEIAPSVILPFVSGLASMPVLYVIGLVWAPVEIHREQEQAVLAAQSKVVRAERELATVLDSRRRKDEITAFSRVIRDQIRDGEEVLSDIVLFAGTYTTPPKQDELHLLVVEWTKATEHVLIKLGVEWREPGADWCYRFQQQSSLDTLKKTVPELRKFMERRIQCLNDFEVEVKSSD